MQRALYVLLGVLLVPAVGLVGDIVTDGRFKSTMSTGAPLEIASSAMVANLNADMVDGVEGTDIYTKAEVDALISSIVADMGPKKYLVTTGFSDGAGPLTLCPAGYHMASIWEITEPSNLDYAYDHPNASTREDSGEGHPTSEPGWIRTGWTGDTDSETGLGNCEAWTSNSSGSWGTVAMVNSSIEDPSAGGEFFQVPGTPWVAETVLCNENARVWCIED